SKVIPSGPCRLPTKVTGWSCSSSRTMRLARGSEKMTPTFGSQKASSELVRPLIAARPVAGIRKATLIADVPGRGVGCRLCAGAEAGRDDCHRYRLLPPQGVGGLSLSAG